MIQVGRALRGRRGACENSFLGSVKENLQFEIVRCGLVVKVGDVQAKVVRVGDARAKVVRVGDVQAKVVRVRRAQAREAGVWQRMVAARSPPYLSI